MIKVFTKDRLPEKAGCYFIFDKKHNQKDAAVFWPDSQKSVAMWRERIEWWIEIPEPLDVHDY